MKHIIILILAILLQGQIIAQNNLIPNYSFEKNNFCPKNYFSHHKVLKKCLNNWYSPTKGTPDYYNKCGGYKAKVPKNRNGKSDAYSGKGYVGFILVYKP